MHCTQRIKVLNAAQWKESFVNNLQDEEIKDVARILGIDPNHLSAEGLQNLKNIFAEAYEITAFIADDPETLDMLTHTSAQRRIHVTR